MPVCIPDALPAAKVLASENIFVMTRQRSTHQDIRPLHIAVLNLMPTKEATETQLLRLIGNTPLQVHVTLLRTATYESQHTAHRHLSTFYRTFEEVRGEKFDALIITGAPVEQKMCIRDSFTVDLSQAYNKFYYDQKIMVDDLPTRAARVLLTKVTRDLLRTAMHLIGLNPPERM